MEITVLKNVLDKNMDQADQNRRLLAEQGIKMINFISSPGAGKTTLLEQAIPVLQHSLRIGIIEGDAYTSKDSERLQKFNAPIVQINTEGACHLDSHSTRKALEELDLSKLDLILVENVGNLICPTSFDLGEEYRIAVLSTSEGDDKPSKYPMLFRQAHSVVLNKIDLLPYVNFNVENFYRDLREINAEIEVFETAAIHGTGIKEWTDRLLKY
jgi:hydrogenase nickel incorporation protein HypB